LKNCKEFNELFDANLMLMETNVQGDILEVNQNYIDFCGYSKEELLQHGFTLLRHPKVKSNLYKKFWHELKTNKKVTTLIYNKSKEKKTIEFSAFSMVYGSKRKKLNAKMSEI